MATGSQHWICLWKGNGRSKGNSVVLMQCWGNGNSTKNMDGDPFSRPKMGFHWLIMATFPCWKGIRDHVTGAPCPAVIPRVLPFPGADPVLRVIYGCFWTSLGNLVKASMEMGRALQISIWILPLLSRKQQQDKGGEESGMLREGLMFPKG